MIHALFIFVVLALFWLGPSLLVARIATRRGRSFGVWFAAALLLCWPIVLVVALIAPARRGLSN